MITSKQRSYLKGLAHSLEPIVLIGKGGVTENIIKEIDTCLENRELVKVKLQEGCEENPKEVANTVAEALHAEFVQAIGHKFVIYRRSLENPTIELPKK